MFLLQKKLFTHTCIAYGGERVLKFILKTRSHLHQDIHPPMQKQQQNVVGKHLAALVRSCDVTLHLIIEAAFKCALNKPYFL